MSGTYQIPFDAKTGDQQIYPGHSGRYRLAETEWRDNFAFGATLRIDGVERGRSAAHFRVKVESCSSGKVSPGTTVWLFLKELMEIVETVGIRRGGLVTGHWTFTKRGQNYGVRLVG